MFLSGRSYAFALFLLVMLLLVSCNPVTPSLKPSLGPVSVGDTIQGVPPEVTVTVVIPGASNKRVRRVTAEFRSTLEPDRPFVFVNGDFSNNNPTWTGYLPELNVGPYEAKVTVMLRPGPNLDGSIDPPIDETLTSGVVSFNVTPDAEECFNFAAVEDDTQGWTHGGYFLVQNNEPTPGCSEELLWFNNTINALMGPNCLPEPQFRFDLVSPDLSSRPAWSQSQGVVLVAGWNLPEMLMQPILDRADGLDSLRSVDDNDQALFYPMTVNAGYLQQFRAPMIFEEGTVNRFRARFFGAPMSTAAEAFARIGSVCPIPDRPG